MSLFAAASCGGEAPPTPEELAGVQITVEAAVAGTTDAEATIAASIAATVTAPAGTTPGAIESAPTDTPAPATVDTGAGDATLTPPPALPLTQVPVQEPTPATPELSGPTPTPTSAPPVAQPPIPINIDLAMEGEGRGKVELSAGTTIFTCDDPRCLIENISTSVATIIAYPNPGSIFQSWSVIGQPGMCAGDGPCELAIGQDDVVVSARFGLSGATVSQTPSETEPPALGWPTSSIAQAARAVHCSPGATTDYSGQVPQRTGIDYSGKDLRGADFEGQDLTCDDFAGANLQGANLTNTILLYTNFEGADLSNADLFFAGALLTTATGAIWQNTLCPGGSIAMEDGAAPVDRIIECPSLTPGDGQPYPGDDQFAEARLQDCPPGSGEDLAARDLSGDDLEGRDLSCADLTYANLSSANLRGANLSGALMWGTNLRDADLTSATLRHAWLNGAKFHNSLLRNVNFDETDLFFTDLTGADLTGASIQNVVWGFETHCGDAGYPWRAGETYDRTTGLECPGTRPVGPPRDLPDDYPSVAGVIGGVYNRGLDNAPVQSFAVWDQCPRLITEAEVTPFMQACVEAYTDAGVIYLSYHPLSGVEEGSTGRDGIASVYPDLFDGAAYTSLDGATNTTGGYNLFSNASDIWLDFIIGMLKVQVDAGMTGVGFDEGWGTLGPGPGSDFSLPAMEGFRKYLEARYSREELLAKGVADISIFNWREQIEKTPVFVGTDFDPGFALTSGWWEQQLGRPLEAGEAYSEQTISLAREAGAGNWEPLLNLIGGDYEYYNRMRLREIYTRIRDEIKPYAAAKGQPWYLSGNIYNSLGWGNAAVGAAVMDLPMGELSTRESLWPSRNFTSFFKNMAALGKRYNSMFHQGQVLHPANDPGTEALLMFLADVYASGGVTQYPHSPEIADPFYQLIQDHENFFTETDNRVALYYSLGNHMGDVDRAGVEVQSYYGAARLLEDSHYSYDVLYQGDPSMGAGTVRWVDQQVTLAGMQEYRVIVLPHTRHMTDTEVQNFLDFVQSGGVLVVFGEAGTHDFAFPTPKERSNPAWGNLTSAAGTQSYGSGSFLVVSDGNIAVDYDGSQEPADLLAFIAAMETVYQSDVTTDFSKDVHIHKWRDPAAGLEVFHLLSFDYDEAAGVVLPTSNNTLAFDPSVAYSAPRVIYYTPDSAAGEILPVTSLASGLLQVTIPTLHVYGVVVLQEG